MNPINRRGQKVRCIADFELELANGELYRGPVPKCGETYTVQDFVDNSGIAVADDGDTEDIGPAIVLFEIGSPFLRVSRRVIGWPICVFRPVDERETDISALIGLGREVRQPEDA